MSLLPGMNVRREENTVCLYMGRSGTEDNSVSVSFVPRTAQMDVEVDRIHRPSLRAKYTVMLATADIAQSAWAAC